MEIMKKIYLNIISATIIAMGCAGCSSDTLFMNGSNQVMANEVVASVEGQNSTRVAMVDGTTKSLIWTSGDQISVFDESGVSGTLELNDDFANKPEGKFGGVLPEEFEMMVSAAYPSEGTELNGTTLTMTIPSAISLADAVTVDGGKAYKFPLPMFGKFDGNYVQFKFLTGMLKLAFGNIPAKTEKVIITANKPISGTFNATISEENNTPILTSTSENDADKTITVTFSEALSSASSKIIYIPLAAQTYSTITVEAAGKYENEIESTQVLATWTDKTVARRMVYTAANGFTIDVDETSPAEIFDAIVATVESAPAGVPVTVNLTGAITTTTNDMLMTIPTENADGAPVDVNLVFSNVPTEAEGAPLTIKTDKATSASTEALNNLYITVPESETGIDLNINAPTSTVVLKSANGTSDNTRTYKEVNARTALNTLVVDDDAKVNNAELEEGTAKVKTNGILESWSFAAEHNGDQVFVMGDGGIEPVKTSNGQWLIATEDGNPYYANSLKIVKGDADYAIVWFGNASYEAIPLKTVVVGDGATLQTNYISMENIVGEGTGQIKYRLTWKPGYTDDTKTGGDKFYEYNSDMSGVHNVVGITFSQPEIAPEERIKPIIEDSIAIGYRMHEPRLNLDVDTRMENCTFNYNHVFFCQEYSQTCPYVKNCKWVHVNHDLDVIPLEKDRVEFRIPCYRPNEYNSITFDGCAFTAGTEFVSYLYRHDPNNEDPISFANDGLTYFTSYITFKDCTRGGTVFDGEDYDFISNINQFGAYLSGVKVVITFEFTGGSHVYEMMNGKLLKDGVQLFPEP